MSANERQTVDSALEFRARFHGIFGESESSQPLYKLGLRRIVANDAGYEFGERTC